MDQFTSQQYPVHASERSLFRPTRWASSVGIAQYPDTNTVGKLKRIMNNLTTSSLYEINLHNKPNF